MIIGLSVLGSAHQMQPIYVEESRIGEYFPLGRYWFKSKRIAGVGPPYLQSGPGGKILYKLSDVEAWMKSNFHNTGKPPTGKKPGRPRKDGSTSVPGNPFTKVLKTNYVQAGDPEELEQEPGFLLVDIRQERLVSALARKADNV